MVDNIGDCKTRLMTHAGVKDNITSMQRGENDNIFSPYSSEAGRHVSFLTDFEDEVMGPEHSFLEHDCDKDLVDVHLGFGTYGSQKCFTLEYDEIIDTDVLHSTLSIGEETKSEFFGGNEGTPAQINEICSSFQDKIDGVGPHVTGKRQHRPPRRYMDEYLVAKANINRRTCEISRNMTSKRELIKAKPRKIKESADIKQEEPFQGACIQVPFGLPLEEEQVKEKSTCLTWSIVPCHDSNNSPSNQSTLSNERSDPTECVSAKLLEHDESRDESDTSAHYNSNSQTMSHRRRKHHLPWTQSEVMNLIEGVSHLGVGKWSKIKKLMFSSSKHRTSVDLKDKWRNLVNASSCIQVHKKKKVRKQLSHQAPKPVLLRVRELAKIYSVQSVNK